MPGAKAARSMRESLDLAAREAHDLVDLGDHVQGVISRLVAAALPTDPSVMMDAQTADLLSQRLEGLARFVRALAEVAPHDLAADVDAAIDTLTLAEQARRLSGQEIGSPSATSDVEAGEPETFWD